MMNQGDFQQHNYNYNPHQHYIAPRRGILDRIFGERIARTLRSPLMVTVLLLLAGGGFAAIVVSAYPNGTGSVPVVQADTKPFKTEPIEAGGMEIPNRDSTIYDSMREANAGSGHVENLLDAGTDEDAAENAEPEAIDITAKVEAPEPAPQAVPVEQKPQAVAKAEPTPAPKPQTKAPPETLHVPGSSPETLAFVRSVLDQEEEDVSNNAAGQIAEVNRNQQPVAKTMNNVEPASGAAKIAGGAIAGDQYFVQLSSITDKSVAPKEWSKLQTAYTGILKDSGYRVQRADLGERGIYYRIQAGPYSKEQASQICGQIKAQKPGGCLVVR